MAQATEPLAALIVAHGLPSAPDGPEAALGDLAERVAELLPTWNIGSATLAKPGALDRAAAALERPLVVFPLFMSDGWFVSEELPRRLAAAEASARITAPLGLHPRIAAICLKAAVIGCGTHGTDPALTTLVIAAHGSPSDPRPRRATESVIDRLEAVRSFKSIIAGYVDEAPHLSQAARISGPCICLPFFAARAGHVEIDLPEALAEAGFPGPLLEPIGLDETIPALIAESLSAAARCCSA